MAKKYVELPSMQKLTEIKLCKNQLLKILKGFVIVYRFQDPCRMLLINVLVH